MKDVSIHHSPWLAQLVQERPHFHLEGDATCDVAVVGAGIAGVSTAYYLLKETDAKVLMIDAGRIAHGATGRNAGQIVSYFERPFEDIVKAFGVEMAVHGQAAVESAFDLLEAILQDCALDVTFHKCVGYAGFSTAEHILEHLEEQHIRATAGLKHKTMLIRIGESVLEKIPAHLKAYVMEVPHNVILDALETDDPGFIAMEASDRGCMNSALFCEELVPWMIERYGDRFTVVEHQPVETVTLERDDAVLTTAEHTITAKRVVLCTNGFSNFRIVNNAGAPIEADFHADMSGIVGYMAGYFDEPKQVPAAISYYPLKQDSGPYYYLTRRPYERDDEKQSLICIGGPERPLPEGAVYDPLSPFPGDMEEQLDHALRHTYRDISPIAKREFLWQGLMGYTRNKIRRIGFEPKNRVLSYNLGCNGVGILPSIYGGKRIAELFSGIKLPPSIFDPERGGI